MNTGLCGQRCVYVLPSMIRVCPVPVQSPILLQLVVPTLIVVGLSPRAHTFLDDIATIPLDALIMGTESWASRNGVRMRMVHARLNFRGACAQARARVLVPPMRMLKLLRSLAVCRNTFVMVLRLVELVVSATGWGLVVVTPAVVECRWDLLWLATIIPVLVVATLWVVVRLTLSALLASRTSRLARLRLRL